MTNAKLVKTVQAALDAYRVEMKKNPDGARERLMKTGIWTKGGKLKPEYGGEPKKVRTAA
jgi:hypothetical protein